MATVVCGLVYVPLCLWEIRFSPNIQPYVYGLQRFFFDAPRFGLGFRPIVFLAHGLECGMFMSVAALLAYGLWLSGAVQEIWGLRFRNAAALLFLTSILCKSVGACTLLACGIVLLTAVRRMRRLTAVWVLLLLPLCYMGLRLSGLWSARELVAISSTLVNEERAGSLEFRLYNEDVLMAKALQHPLLGWGGFNRNRVFNEAGKDLTVTDGYWIILLGINGLIGLTAVAGLFVAPVGRTLWNLPKRCGLEPDDAPALATGVAMTLYLIDFMSNAYLSPFYGLALGGLASYTPAWTERRGRSLDPGLSAVGGLVAAGELETAELLCRHVIETGAPGCGAPASLAGVAAGQQALGEVLAASGRHDEACASLAAAADSWQRHAAESPGDGMAFEGIADTYEQLARLMKARQRSGEAIEYWREALAFRDRLAAAGHSPVPLADILNDLAWFLTFGPDLLFRDPAAAVGLAERAVALLPDRVCYWNTLGAAYCRSGRPLDALRALNRAVELGEGGTAFDHYLLTSTHAQIGNTPEVRRCFERAEWLALRLDPGHPELAELRADASECFARVPASIADGNA
jgi:tetratricopeptide (TPR) repeat protein